MTFIANHNIGASPASSGFVKNSRLLAFGLALAVQGSARFAAAADAESSEPPSEKAACLQAFEQGQRFQKDTKYLAANRELLKCANPTCGDVLFRECSKMYREVQDAIPTLVFSARDAQSNSDRTDVSVTMDGEEILQHIDGRPVLVDPGAHHFSFAVPGHAPVEQDHVIQAGDKFRQIAVVFEAPPSQRAATLPVDSEPPKTSGGRSVPAGSFVLGGVGIAALGVFGVLRAIGASDYDSLDQRCSPHCTQSEADKVRREYSISNIAAGVGGAALAGALVIYLVAPSSSRSVAALGVAPTSGGMSARLMTRF